MFYKKVNKSNRSEMINFLKNHFRYNTMNSCNKSTSYANNVKLQNLNIPEEKMNMAYDIISGDVDTSILQQDINDLIYMFKEETGYDAGFNGRSDGYLVLYKTKFDIDQNRIVTCPGQSIDMYTDFENKDEWPINELRHRVKLIQKFDSLCDHIRDTFLQVLDDCEIIETEIEIKRTLKTLKIKE